MPALEDDASSILPASAHSWRQCHKRALDSSASPLLNEIKKNQVENRGKDNTLCWSVILAGFFTANEINREFVI